MIAIIDYDAGNIRSVEKALLALGQDVTVTADRDEILHADKVILPGVGAFGDAMEKLKQSGLDEVLSLTRENLEGSRVIRAFRKENTISWNLPWIAAFI